MQPDPSFRSKLFIGKFGLFSPDHEQIADGLYFKRKGLLMGECSCFFEVFDANIALCKCQMRRSGLNSLVAGKVAQFLLRIAAIPENGTAGATVKALRTKGIATIQDVKFEGLFRNLFRFLVSVTRGAT